MVAPNDSSSPDESITQAGESTPTTTTSKSSRKSQQLLKFDVQKQLEQRLQQEKQQGTAERGGEKAYLKSEERQMPSKPPRSRREEMDKHSYDGDDGSTGLGGCLAMMLTWPVLIAAAIIIPVFGITFIIVGIVFISDCSIEPMIPIWLIVQGVIMLFGIGTGGMAKRMLQKSDNVSVPIKVLGIIVSLLTAAWFIAGNVWVYQAWAQKPDYAHYWFENGCDQSLFRVAYIGIIVLDILFIVSIVVACVAFVLRGCKSR